MEEIWLNGNKITININKSEREKFLKELLKAILLENVGKRVILADLDKNFWWDSPIKEDDEYIDFLIEEIMSRWKSSSARVFHPELYITYSKPREYIDGGGYLDERYAVKIPLYLFL